MTNSLEAVSVMSSPIETTRSLGIAALTLTIATLATIDTNTSIAHAAPTAEVAKRCLHYAYVVYPFKRPGSVSMSGGRQTYFRDCIAKNGDVPVPQPSNKTSSASIKN